ncbi:50S ribosomal protein L33 [Ectobacillus polymachus]
MRVIITLACTETGDRNYITTKNKRNHPERIELKKYCPRLKRHTLHRETK